jgi:hypothetical protein
MIRILAAVPMALAGLLFLAVAIIFAVVLIG